ncbi:MAG: glycoside hydrolase family 3 C-terminal domain-containing protein, partial [Vallitaleaceae bacterium]|nr:glycoside hydrolase family 3 C-terminal domain-containing protein [Vallitaleaceae bacterium]
MDIQKIISQLTLEEKVLLLEGKDAWFLNGVERLDVPSILVTDGPHGVRLSEGFDLKNIKPATNFPSACAMAASWNKELLSEAGRAMADECHHYGVSVLLGPGTNMKRSPLGGRNFEYYSEDPYLSGAMATAFINGVQAEGIGTSLKHFAVNDQETNRMRTNATLDERALREIYLVPFEMAVKEAKPWTMMGAYNRVRGDFACENKMLLQDILRDEWGYEGLVMSDWGAVIHKVETIRNGLDLEMPGPGFRRGEVMGAIEDGSLSMTSLDERVKHVLELIDLATTHKKEVKADFEKNHAVALKMAQESIVLLKNEDSILPLIGDLKIAVIGEQAIKPRFQGGGSSIMKPAFLENALDNILHLSKNVVFAKGYDGHKKEDAKSLILEALKIAEDADVVVVFVGTTDEIESEGYDRANMSLAQEHLDLLDAICEVHSDVVVVLSNGSAVTLPFEKKVKGIVEGWLLGQAGGKAIAQVLFGHINPSGKLTETFPLTIQSTPAYGYFPGDINEVTYNEGIFVGYRYYDTKGVQVQYPFGYGLSYTSFVYNNFKMAKASYNKDEKVTFTVDITNTGKVFGQEIVQVYVKDTESLLVRPEKELKVFKKVKLQSGETKTIEF